MVRRRLVEGSRREGRRERDERAAVDVMKRVETRESKWTRAKREEGRKERSSSPDSKMLDLSSSVQASSLPLFLCRVF